MAAAAFIVVLVHCSNINNGSQGCRRKRMTIGCKELFLFLFCFVFEGAAKGRGFDLYPG